NYKDQQPHGVEIKTHAIEYETDVSSLDQLRKILHALGFRKLIDVKKVRRVWEYLDVEISLDEVEELGSFIELEYKGQLTDVAAARKQLFSVLEKLGAKTDTLAVKGYPHLLLAKKKLI